MEGKEGAATVNQESVISRIILRLARGEYNLLNKTYENYKHQKKNPRHQPAPLPSKLNLHQIHLLSTHPTRYSLSDISTPHPQQHPTTRNQPLLVEAQN